MATRRRIYSLWCTSSTKPRQVHAEGTYADLNYGECGDELASLAVYYLHDVDEEVFQPAFWELIWVSDLHFGTYSLCHRLLSDV